LTEKDCGETASINTRRNQVRVLKTTLLFQILVGFYWAFPIILDGVRGWGGLYLLIVVFLPILAVVPIAIWSFFKRPETRRIAAVVFFAPILIFLAPLVFRQVFGDIIGSPGGGFSEASAAIVVVLVAMVVLVPGRVAGLIPVRLLRSRRFNVTLVVSLSVMLVAWLALLALFMVLVAHDPRNIVFALLAPLYPIVCGLTAIPILVYSYFAMFQRVERENHRLRIAQLVLSIAVLIPSVLSLAFLVKLAPLMVPPG
jgi:hypothetical protein